LDPVTTAVWLVFFDLIILSILRSSVRYNDIASLVSEIGRDASEKGYGILLTSEKN
jgi:hypothetical protein